MKKNLEGYDEDVFGGNQRNSGKSNTGAKRPSVKIKTRHLNLGIEDYLN